MVAFIVGVSTIFLRQLLIEKGALVEFSDRMSNISLMAPATTFKRQEQFLSWECGLYVIVLPSERLILCECWRLPQMGGEPHVVPRQVPELSWLTGGSCVLIDGGFVCLELSHQVLLLWVQKFIKKLLAGIFLQKRTRFFFYGSLKYGET